MTVYVESQYNPTRKELRLLATVNTDRYPVVFHPCDEKDVVRLTRMFAGMYQSLGCEVVMTK